MTRPLIRLLFCAAIAMLAASLADPLIEFASNAGWFGSGNFTDHSNLDVIPAAAAGLIALLLHCGLRLRAALGRRSRRTNWLCLSNRALGPSVVSLLPAIFALQIGALFAMESSEQLLVAGHLLGGAIWLGAPIAISLSVHALACVIVAAAVSRLVRAFAQTAIRVIGLVYALQGAQSREAISIFRHAEPRDARFDSAVAFGSLPERAPPFLHA